ncbi:hypothetical protein U1Q18_002912 [Sarracenia purpurea var. burkii]
MAGYETALYLSVGLMVMLLVSSSSEARDFLVGGSTDAWKIPSSPSDSLNQWAESSRFLIGDSLVWKYESGKDSVVQVSKRDYETCNTSNPIAEYKDGNTKVNLSRSGPFFFISGADGHCQKGQKLIVVVLSASHQWRHYLGVAPAPSPVEVEGPAVAPTSGATSLQADSVVALLSLGVVFWLGWF